MSITEIMTKPISQFRKMFYELSKSVDNNTKDIEAGQKKIKYYDVKSLDYNSKINWEIEALGSPQTAVLYNYDGAQASTIEITLKSMFVDGKEFVPETTLIILGAAGGDRVWLSSYDNKHHTNNEWDEGGNIKASETSTIIQIYPTGEGKDNRGRTYCDMLPIYNVEHL